MFTDKVLPYSHQQTSVYMETGVKRKAQSGQEGCSIDGLVGDFTY